MILHHNGNCNISITRTDYARWFMVWPLIYQQLYTSKLDWTLIKGDYTKAWKLYFLFLFTGKQDNMANGQRNIYSERWNNIDHKFNETNYL